MRGAGDSGCTARTARTRTQKGASPGGRGHSRGMSMEAASRSAVSTPSATDVSPSSIPRGDTLTPEPGGAKRRTPSWGRSRSGAPPATESQT